MSTESPTSSTYFGIPVSEYPEPCLSCHRMANLVLKLNNPDVTKQRPYPFPESEAKRMARIVFSRLDMCTDEICGLSVNALHTADDLE